MCNVNEPAKKFACNAHLLQFPRAYVRQSSCVELGIDEGVHVLRYEMQAHFERIRIFLLSIATFC